MTTTRDARCACPSQRRGLIPPLTVALTATTALALLVLALTLAPLPTTRAQLASPPAWPLARPLSLAVTTTRLAQTMPLTLPSGSVVLTLARLRLLPGSGGQSRTQPGPLLLVVEAGVLTADLGGPALVVRADGLPATASRLLLQPGDQLTLPAGTPAALRDAGAIPTVVVAAAIMPAATDAGPGPPQLRAAALVPLWDPAWMPGATSQSLISGWLMPLPRPAVTMTLLRLELAAGASTSLTTASGLALGVDAGALTLARPQGSGRSQTPRGPDVVPDPADPATLLPGDGALLQHEAAARCLWWSSRSVRPASRRRRAPHDAARSPGPAGSAGLRCADNGTACSENRFG